MFSPRNPQLNRDGELIHLLSIEGLPRAVLTQILDTAGEQVRHLVIANPIPGSTEIAWDGLNDAGRATAPGVYRGWLVAGDSRSSVRLVRVP